MDESHSSGPPATGCPSVETLRAFARGQSAQEERHSIATHLAECSRCSELLLALPEMSPGIVDSLRQPEEMPASTTVPERPRDVAARATLEAKGASGPDELPALRLGRYAIRKQIGKGGFGTVYLAHDEELDRLVAVKVPYAHRLSAPGQLHAYHTEARLHASLDHPNIVPIYDVGRATTIPFYLVSKLIAGEDLATRIKRDRPGARDAARLLLPLAEALEHMHSRGLVHRDVKPRNILLDTDGAPYLADFGLAIRPAPPDEDKGDKGVVAGTPGYMSPEQARGEAGRVDGRSDTYSLGVVLYELLTGARPFSGDFSTLRHQVLNDEPPRLRALAPNVPRDLEAICRKAMAKGLGDRYQRAAHLAEDLRCFLRNEPPPYARPVGAAGGRALSWLRRHSALVLLTSVAAVALLLATLLYLRQPPTGPGGEPVDRPTVRVVVQAHPPGGALSYFPLHPETGLPRPEQVVRGKAGEPVSLSSGHYLIVAVLEGKAGEGERFHEVFRLVPSHGTALPGLYRHHRWKFIDGTIHLADITIPPAAVTKGMCLFPAANDFVMGSAELPLAPPHRRTVPAFYLDPTEVTKGAYGRWLRGPAFDREPNIGDRNLAASSVTWDQAAAYAEKIGKRLPDETEYEYAATACGKRRFPWGDAPPDLFVGDEWAFGPVGEPAHDRAQLPGQPPVFGLYSNVAEWTSSWLGNYPDREQPVPPAMLRVVRGGPHSVARGSSELRDPVRGPRERIGFNVPSNYPGLGFRCARSNKPRLTAGDFITIRPR